MLVGNCLGYMWVGQVLGFAVSEENWFAIKESRVHGVPEGSAAVRLVEPSDVAIFYVKKRDARSLDEFLIDFKL